MRIGIHRLRLTATLDRVPADDVIAQTPRKAHMKLLIPALVLCGAAAGAWAADGAASAPTGNASAATTPSDLPPGATSTKGNKGATPAGNNAGGATDPKTGSTAGMPPGATSATGNKAETPKGSGTHSAPAPARKASAPMKSKDGRVEGSREETPPAAPK